MDLQGFLASVRRGWALIVLSMLVFLLAAVGYSLAVPKKYESHTQLYLSVASNDSTSGELAQAAVFSQNIVNSYVYVATSSVVLDPVIEQLGLNTDAVNLAERITASSIPQTGLIDVSATAGTPEEAAQLANAVGEQLKEAVQTTLEPGAGSAGSPIHLTTTKVAQEEPEPVSPLLGQNIALGLLAGLTLGLALALMRSAVDTRIYSPQEVADVTDIPVLGVVAATNSQGIRSTESFRRLRSNTAFQPAAAELSTFVITSARQSLERPGITANLARALAESGKKVAVVDADLRNAELGKRMGVAEEVGIAQVLSGEVTLDQAMQRQNDANLDVLAAGVSSADPNASLDAAGMSAMFTELAHAYDHVIVDAPPVLEDVAAAVMARPSGKALVAVTAGRTRRPELAEALGVLESAGADVAGIVLSRDTARRLGSGRKALSSAAR